MSPHLLYISYFWASLSPSGPSGNGRRQSNLRVSSVPPLTEENSIVSKLLCGRIELRNRNVVWETIGAQKRRVFAMRFPPEYLEDNVAMARTPQWKYIFEANRATANKFRRLVAGVESPDNE